MLQWLDEFCLHADSKENVLVVIEKLFDICQPKELKVQAKKINLYCTRVNFCGRLLEAWRGQLNPQGLATLKKVPASTSTAQLQQLACSAN